MIDRTPSLQQPDRDIHGVHVVSEHIFCHRAALNTYLDSYEDRGQDASILRLDYQPCYDLHELERRLAQATTAIWQLGIAAVVFVVIGALLGNYYHWPFTWAGLAGSLILLHSLVKRIPTVLSLQADCRAARTTGQQEPSARMPHDEPIGWWAMRAAGFEPTPCDELLVDEELNIQGRPWRILRKGDLAIPAYVGSGADNITPQQRSRIAAYCHLVEQNEGKQSPYGIILIPGTFTGTAVKPTTEDLDRVRQALQQLPRTVDDYLRHRRAPGPPQIWSICAGCPHGAPRKLATGHSDTTSLGTVVKPYRRKSPIDRCHYHSSCGDRFGWVPPHEQAIALQL